MAYHGTRWKQSIANPAEVFYRDLNAAVEDLETEEDSGTIPWTDIELSRERGHSDHGFLQAGNRLQASESSINVSLRRKSRRRICFEDCYSVRVSAASPRGKQAAAKASSAVNQSQHVLSSHLQWHLFPPLALYPGLCQLLLLPCLMAPSRLLDLVL